MTGLIPPLSFSKEKRKKRQEMAGWDEIYTFSIYLFIHSFIYSLIFSAYNSLIFMLMAALGGGRVLMTYLSGDPWTA